MARGFKQFVCIHGHFYQPPRESAWTERIARQPSARPYHDWNERIDAECYAPNGRARILDEEGRLAGIVNNYARISFNFGPTLLSWFETEAPATYRTILDADRESRDRFTGHGSAIAQAYNHMILPLANARDQKTQVAWGARDFERRFGRRAEGMWLPETAADTPSLEALAEAGVAFTLLSPRQARAVIDPEGKRVEVNETTLDCGRPYRVDLPSGRQIVVFFYDGSTSQAVAFERLLSDGAGFARKLLASFSKRDTDDEPNLVHIATDGETYGHHHRFGEMALAWATEAIRRDPLIRLTNYGEFLEASPPKWRAEIVEKSSWSCFHGVGRWNTNCGCRMRGDSNQLWRAPLREALDRHRDDLEALFEARGAALFRDVWAARDAFIDVVLDRSAESTSAFLRAQGRDVAPGSDRAKEALTLLEVQRHAMLMYTSCGWFFDDVHGIETLQIMEYAVRAAELATEIDGKPRVNALIEDLDRARVAALDSRRDLIERRIREARASEGRLTAHVAVGALFGDAFPPLDSRAHVVAPRELTVKRGDETLATGKVDVTNALTGRTHSFAFSGVLAGDTTDPMAPFRVSITDAATGASESWASLDARRPHNEAQFVERRLARVEDEVRERLREIHERCEPVLRALAPLSVDPPKTLLVASKLVLQGDIARALAAEAPDVTHVEELLQRAQEDDLHLDREGLGHAAASMVLGLARRLAARDEAAEPAWNELGRAIRVARRISSAVDLRGTEDVVWSLRRERPAPPSAARSEVEALLKLSPRVDMPGAPR